MATANRLTQAGKLKVLFILDAFPDPGAGTEGQFWLLYRGLDRSRIEPSILLLRHSEFLERHLGREQVRVLEVERLRSPGNLGKILRAARWARAAGFQVAHIFFNDSALVFPLPLALSGIRVIVSRRDLGFWYSRANLPLLRFNVRFVDAVVANCAAVSKIVVASEGYRPAKVRVIYNGITRQLAAHEARAEWGLPAGAQILVLVANLRPLKRIGDAIRALARVANEHTRAHLFVVGEDRDAGGRSHREELQALAQSLGVLDRVRFTGKLADPMPLICAADICMLTSQTEGLSNAVVEYMFSGKPVVCTDAGGNAELIRHEHNGYVAPIGDVDAIAAGLRSLLADARLRDTFGARSAERARALFDPQRMITDHERLYQELAGAAA